MKMVNNNRMVRRAAGTMRPIAVILIIVVSLQDATAQVGSPPTGILVTIEQPLYAGRSYEATCRGAGLEAPYIFWTVDDELLVYSEDQLLIPGDGNKTVSILVLRPSPDDNGKILKCQAQGERGMEESSVNLLVYYSPVVSLYIERPQRPDGIREGDNVTLRCVVQSNPPMWRVRWMFQGRLLQETDFNEPLNETLSLNVNDINRTQAGNYSCVVSNPVGDAESSPVQLIVNYKPVCRSQHPLVYATALGEVVQFDCQVDALPPTDMYRYRWMFSRFMQTDGETTPFLWRVTGSDREKTSYLEWASGVSWRTYKPKYDMDYGTFYCSAENALGMQQEPCVFHVVPPGRPDPPSNCSVLNETTDSFTVQCPLTTDGGFRQGYQLEVFDVRTGHVKFNKTQRSPDFLVGGLESSRAITMRIAAISPRGRSEWFTMNTFTVALPPTSTSTSTVHPGVLPKFLGLR